MPLQHYLHVCKVAEEKVWKKMPAIRVHYTCFIYLFIYWGHTIQRNKGGSKKNGRSHTRKKIIEI